MKKIKQVVYKCLACGNTVTVTDKLISQNVACGVCLSMVSRSVEWEEEKAKPEIKAEPISEPKAEPKSKRKKK